MKRPAIAVVAAGKNMREIFDMTKSAIDQAREALERSRKFIHNGRELGFIRMPEDIGDPAWEVPTKIDRALTALKTLNAAPLSAERGELTFAHFLEKNRERQKYWPSENWSMERWITALTGELGEAANIVKKTFRGDMTEDEARPKLAKEFADILTYLVITADKAGVDLAAVAVEKFNEVSDRINSPVKISLAQPEPARCEGKYKVTDNGDYEWIVDENGNDIDPQKICDLLNAANPPSPTKCEAVGKEYCARHDRHGEECHAKEPASSEQAEVADAVKWASAQVEAGKSSVYPHAKNIKHLEALITAATKAQG